VASWRDYWNQDTPIYVSERHKLLHYRLIARDIAELIPGPDATVLDYGCGEALAADSVAARCRALLLVDAAPLVRERLGERFRDVPAIRVLAPEAVESLPDGSLDLVVMNSVAQYLTLEELRAALDLIRRKLGPEGRLVVADVIPPETSALTDARALLSFALKGGFLMRALVGLARTATSDYRSLREELGLSTYGEDDMLALLEATGFRGERRARNIGHNQARMTFLASPL
jgi:SAM-dependent methyltransferase